MEPRDDSIHKNLLPLFILIKIENDRHLEELFLLLYFEITISTKHTGDFNILFYFHKNQNIRLCKSKSAKVTHVNTWLKFDTCISQPYDF